MNAAYRKQRADDLPLKGTIVRERKGVYAVVMKFAKSHRHYDDELVWASNQKQVKAYMLRRYPTLKWGKK